MSVCQKCGSIMPDHAKFCGKCGADMTQASTSSTTKCEMCGRAKRSDDRFCPVCGYDSTGQVKAPAPQPTPQYGGPVPSRVTPPATSYSQPPPQAPQYQQPDAYQPYNYQQPVSYQQQVRTCSSCHSALAPNQQVCPYCGTRILSFNRKDRAGQAGGLIIASAVLNVLIFGIALLGIGLLENTSTTDMEAAAIISIVVVILNLFAIWGGIQAINRRKYVVSMISAVISIFGALFFLGIIAVILLALSSESFVDRPVKNNNFGNYGGGY